MAISQLPLTPDSGSARSCCCSPSGARAVDRVEPVPSSATESYGLLGLTCGGCASRVETGLRGLDGVLDVQVTPVPGGVSTAVVTSARPLAHSAVADAVLRAGYRIAGSPDAPAQASSCCSR